MSKQIDLSKLSAAELEQMLKEKKKEENALQEAKRKRYEDDRNALISDLGGFAETLVLQMLDLKRASFIQLSAFREQMLEYGSLRRGERNKGSFEIKNEDYKIIFTSQINKRFDERAELAETKLRAFLESFIRKKDKAVYSLVKSLLEKNKAGDYDIDLINRLYKMENDFEDQNWKDAIRLFKESYNPYGTAQYVRFFKKNTTNNAWEAIVLDFAKLGTKVAIEPEPEVKE